MAKPHPDQEYVNYLVDLMQSIGPVYAKRMFGGHGIFLAGAMFGLVVDRCLYLKVDDQTRGTFEEQGLEPFTYRKKDKLIKLSYHQAPAEAIESMDEMIRWANLSYAAALRVAQKKS